MEKEENGFMKQRERTIFGYHAINSFTDKVHQVCGIQKSLFTIASQRKTSCRFFLHLKFITICYSSSEIHYAESS